MADDVLIDRLDLTIDLLLARRDATAALTDPELAPLAVLAAELRHVPSTAFRDPNPSLLCSTAKGSPIQRSPSTTN